MITYRGDSWRSDPSLMNFDRVDFETTFRFLGALWKRRMITSAKVPREYIGPNNFQAWFRAAENEGFIFAEQTPRRLKLPASAYEYSNG